MTDDIRRVLDLLAQGKISVDEAEELLRAFRTAQAPGGPAPKADQGEAAKPRYLRINVHKAPTDHGREKDVNIRVPLSIVRGGMRLGAIIPGLGDRIISKARERGIDLAWDKLDPAQIDALVRDLGEMTIDVDEGRQQVRISCE